MPAISAQELAELVPCPFEHVRRLERLGLLSQGDADGRFPSSDVHVVRLMGAFEEAGLSLEDVARGVAAGELSFPMGLFLPEPVGLDETYGELATGLGRSSELVRRLSAELGLPGRPGPLRSSSARSSHGSSAAIGNTPSASSSSSSATSR